MDRNHLCETEAGVCMPNKNGESEKKKDFINDQKSNMKLVYYYDPLCGWCYGFSPVVAKVKEKYSNNFNIEVVSGGLFLGNRVGAINDVAPHIKAGAYKVVEQRTGVQFGDQFLDDVFGEAKMTLNSLPPTIALRIVKEKFPEKELDFAGMLLAAVYLDGLDPIDIMGLSQYAVKVGLDKEEFLTKMKEPKYKSAVEKEFELFKNSKYAAMPALVLVKDGKEYLVSQGYMSYDNVKARLDALLNDL